MKMQDEFQKTVKKSSNLSLSIEKKKFLWYYIYVIEKIGESLYYEDKQA